MAAVRAFPQWTVSAWREDLPIDGTDDHRVTVAKQWEEARAATGIDPKVVLYCTRHEYGSSLAEFGIDLVTIKKLMGHSSVTVTERYLHSHLKGAAEAINKINVDKGIRLVKSA